MTSKKTGHCPVVTSRLVSAGIALFLSLMVTSSVVVNSDAHAVNWFLVQTTKTAAATANGTVVGTLNLNGKDIRLRYGYARTRKVTPLDAERLYFFQRDRKPEDGGIVELIITNQPVAEDLLTKIVEDNYHGSAETRGIRLIIDSFGKEAFQVNYFLLQSDPVAVSGFATNEGRAKIENGSVKGKIDYKIESASSIRTYSVSFDVPLKN